jgi:hypothetical protein
MATREEMLLEAETRGILPAKYKTELEQLKAGSNVKKIERSTGDWRKEIPKYTRLALEMGGGLAGGALGATAGPVGAVAGAGLGYAAGRQIQNSMEERAGMRPIATFPQALGSTAQGLLEGAAMEAGGVVLGKGMEVGMKAAGKWAPRIYNAVAKFGKVGYGSQEKQGIEMAEDAIKSRIPISDKGLKKVTNNLDSLNSQIDNIIKSSKDEISVNEILKPVEDVKKTFANSDLPSERIKPIQEYIEKFKAEHPSGKISVPQAQEMKKWIYKQLKYGEEGSAVEETMKAVARGEKEGIQKIFPELSVLNAKDGAMIRLKEVLTKTMNRLNKRDIAGLPEILGSTAGGISGAVQGKDLRSTSEGIVGGALFMRLLRSPAVISRLAFALDKASKMGGAPTLSRMAGYGISKAVTPDISGPASQAAGKLDPASQAQAAEGPDKGISAAKRGIVAYTSNRWDEAITEWRKALKEEPGRSKEIIGWINKALAEKKGANGIYKRKQIEQLENEQRAREQDLQRAASL